MDVSSTITTGFTKIDKVQGVEVDARNCLGDIDCQISRITAIPIESMEEDNDSFWSGSGF